jgi:hypothetical protein
MLEDGYSYELDASGSGACCVGGLWLLLLQLYACFILTLFLQGTDIYHLEAIISSSYQFSAG